MNSMKIFLLVILYSTMQFALGEEKSSVERNSECMSLGQMFKLIAEWRDSGQSPEFTLARIAYFEEFSIDVRKKAINVVYFDPAFSNARGHPLLSEIFRTCLYGPREPFKPLK